MSSTRPDPEMTDREVAGSEILLATDYESPVGTLRLVASKRGLRAVLWPNDTIGLKKGLEKGLKKGPENTRERDRVKLGPVREGTSDVLSQTAAELDEYFAGEREVFEVPLDPVGTEFQLEVWRGLAEVPYGQTTTYGRQAEALGRPKSVRAVASANGKNPISIILPCHRIIGADGSLTGFAGGLDGKAWLLAHEGQTLRL